MIQLLALIAHPAWSFAPQPSSEVTSLEPQRIQHQHSEVQGRLLRSEAWQAFSDGDGRGWSARFDEHTLTPRVMWGRGIPLPTASEAVLTEALLTLLQRHAVLLGTTGADLRVKSASYVDRLETWYVDVDVLREGLPTYRGGLSARIKHGNLILLHVATAPNADVTGDWTLSADGAIAAAIAGGPAPGVGHTDASAEALLLDHKTLSGHVLRKTWMVRTRTADPVGIWVSFVDGLTGEILNVHNEVRFVTGEVSGEHHERTVDGSPLVTSGMPYVEVSSDSDADVADEDGVYTVATGSPYTTDLNGDYVRVYNSAGGEGFLSRSSADMTWDSGDATQAEIDTYVFVHHVKEWGEAFGPEVDMVTDDLTAYVNISDNCNAYWDGTINFFSAGGGCNNTGQIADVVYHEWGHGFHYFSIEAGFFDGSLSEGAGDTLSFLQTGDSLMAPYFGDSGWAIRDVAPDEVYPNDYVADSDYVHTNGLIFGGSFYDLLDLLQDKEGDELGHATTSRIFADTLKGGTDIVGSFYEALAADDDDGNLDNGTPNTCEIYEAFGRHGLGPGAGDETIVIASHQALTSVPAGADHEVELELVEVQGGCQDGTAEWADVSWRTAGGAWQTVAMTVSGSDITGAIPAQAPGTIVEYYIAGESLDGVDFAAPNGQQVNPYTFIVGDVLEIHCDDFESDDGGYTHQLVAGEDQDGADDWQWGTPNGNSGDPASAASGTQVWGNDLGHDNFNGAYQPEKTNRLTSGTVETGHYTDVFLQYQRWLQIEDATFDQASILANGELVWSNWQGDSGEEHHLDGGWAQHLVALDGVADQGEVQFDWELATDVGLEFGGWTLDDVCVMAPATPNNRLGIVDFEVQPLEDTLMGLRWTNPMHAPVERVVVTRRFDRLPTGFDDGDIVFDDPDPALGEPVVGSDLNFHEGDAYYAVYAFDGTAWLTWTEPGWNADMAPLVGGTPPPGWPTDGDGDGVVGTDNDTQFSQMGGCGCSGSGTAAGWLAGLLAALVVRRRSRV